MAIGRTSKLRHLANGCNVSPSSSQTNVEKGAWGHWVQTVSDNFTNVHATAVSERRAGGGKSSGDTWCAPAGGEHGGVILGDESVTLVYVYGPRKAT